MQAIIATALVCASNPIVPKRGMADPNVRLMDGKTFLVWATHDFSMNNTGFRMDDWWVWSSSDLIKWTLESRVVPRDVFKWDTVPTECWATDAALHNGTYFFYVSVGGSSIAVATASSPRGPWHDPLGKPLLDDTIGKSLQPPTTFRDPAIFTDDDGRRYMIAGVFTYYMAELSEDMISFAGPMRHITVHNPYGACGKGRTDDKPFLHKHGQIYYLSWGCFYATSRSLFGPYEMAGSVIDTARIAPSFRIGAPRTPWFMSEDYTDRHGSFLHAHGQWYFATNDRSHSGDKHHEGSYRDTVMGYVHYRHNGTMEPMVINATGVAEYDARSPIEAENFFSLKGGRKVDLRHTGGGDGFAVGLQAQTDGSELLYPRVSSLPRTRNATFVMRCASAAEGLAYGRRDDALRLEVRVAPSTGGLLTSDRLLAGWCSLPPVSKSWATYTEVRCPLQLPYLGDESDGQRLDVSLRLARREGAAMDDVLRIDWFAIV